VTATEQERLLMSPAEAAQMLGIGRTKLYDLIAAGHLRPVHIGRCCRLSPDELRSFVDRLEEQR
jgi:excisionase family DNA binding protein